MTSKIERDFADAAKALVEACHGCLMCWGKYRQCLVCHGRAFRRSQQENRGIRFSSGAVAPRKDDE